MKLISDNITEQRVREIIREELLKLGLIKEGVSLSEEQLKKAGLGHLMTMRMPDGSARPIDSGSYQMWQQSKQIEQQKKEQKEQYIKGTDKPIDI